MWKINKINQTLSHPTEGWWISYCPSTKPDKIFNFFGEKFLDQPNDNQEETALMNGDEQLIMKGNFQDKMESAFPSLEACRKVFYNHPEARSAWTVEDPKYKREI